MVHNAGKLVFSMTLVVRLDIAGRVVGGPVVQATAGPLQSLADATTGAFLEAARATLQPTSGALRARTLALRLRKGRGP